MSRARQAAEALFTPKQQETALPASSDAPSAEPPARKPRILETTPPAAVHHEAATASARPERQMTSEIPASQFGRIRTWVKYGMTVSQVAQVYGVAIGEIERILRQA